MIRFFKGIVVGIGGVAPGLSGSVLLIIFGLYQKNAGSTGHTVGLSQKEHPISPALSAGDV